MKLSERIRNPGRDAGDYGYDDWADEVAQLEAENERLESKLVRKQTALMHYINESHEYQRKLRDALKEGE